jgi:hypothetical protein
MGRPITGIQYRGVALYEAERTIALTFRGHVSVAEMTRLLQTAGELVAEAPHAVTGVLWDGIEHESHDPAVISQGIKWSLEHRAWYRRSALVSRSTRLASIVHIAKGDVPVVGGGHVCDTRGGPRVARAGHACPGAGVASRRASSRRVIAAVSSRRGA